MIPYSPQHKPATPDMRSFQELKRQVEHLRISIPHTQIQRRHTRQFSVTSPGQLRQAITPNAGIPGYSISSGTIGYASAICRRVVWDSNANEGTIGDEIEVYNPVEQQIAGNTLVSYIPHGDDPSKMFAIVESCGATAELEYIQATSGDVQQSNPGATWTTIPYSFTINSSGGQWAIVNGGQGIQYQGDNNTNVRIFWRGAISTSGNNQVVNLRAVETTDNEQTLPVQVSLGSSGTPVSFQLISAAISMQNNDIFQFEIQQVSGGGNPTFTTNGVVEITAFAT